MCSRRFWWFCRVFVNASAYKLFNNAEGRSYLFPDHNSDSRASRCECWKIGALSGFFSPQHEQCENESESAYKYPRCPILVLTTCPPFLGMTTLNTSMRLKSQNPTFTAWIYQNRCFGILNLRTSFSAVFSSEQWSYRHFSVSCSFLFLLPVDSIITYIFFSKNRSIY